MRAEAGSAFFINEREYLQELKTAVMSLCFFLRPLQKHASRSDSLSAQKRMETAVPDEEESTSLAVMISIQ
jgi:hypothetical protein